jgi:hypothetical protein
LFLRTRGSGHKAEQQGQQAGDDFRAQHQNIGPILKKN